MLQRNLDIFYGVSLSYNSELSSNLDWLFKPAEYDIKPALREVIRSNRNVTDLTMINPDIPPPRLLVDRLMEASNRPSSHKYTVSRGIEKLRRAFTLKYSCAFNVELDLDHEVCVTRGSKEGILLALKALCSPGERILIPSPTYPTYSSAALALGLTTETYAVSHDHNKMLSSIVDSASISKVKAVILNFPNNPTSVSVTSEFYSELLRSLKGKGIYIINDFVYGEMSFNQKPFPSLLETEEHREMTLEVYSLSKAYSVPGWRVGAVLGAAKVIDCISKLKSHLDYGTFQPIQEAASHALQAKKYLGKSIVEEYSRRANSVVEILSQSSWELELPEGSTFLWLKLPENCNWENTFDFSLKLLSDFKIAVFAGYSVWGKLGKIF